MHRWSHFFIFWIFIVHTISRADSSCQKWFEASKLETGTVDCELKCSMLPVDMGTFDCPSRCESLCKMASTKSEPPFTYPKGMTKGDRRMVAKYPKDAIKVYQAKQKADDLTSKIFKKTGRNDESDAFRHFIWAALVTKELGARGRWRF